jgi:4-amino-4-deoxy-L-arabinose transferase-like glycosyltransferase
MNVSTPTSATRPRWVIYVLGGVLLFFVLNNAVWLLTDNTPPSYDKAYHTTSALKYLRLIQAPTQLSPGKLLTVTQYWPPFFHVCSVLFTLVLGFSVQSVAATNFLFLVVAVYSIYKIGQRLFDDAVGVGAAAITMLYPMVFALSREVLVDFALMAMVVLSLHLILESDGGLDGRRSWLLGAALGCAMLTKWTAVAFLIGPGLLWFALHVRDRRQPFASKAWALVILVVVCAAVALPWYVKSYAQFRAGARIALGSDPSREGDPVQLWESIQWYWYALRDALVSKRLMPITALGIAIYIFSTRAWKGLAFLLCWTVPALVIFLIIPNKDGRFIVPLLPALALMTAAGLQRIPWKALRVLAWTFIVVVGSYQFYTISFGWPTAEAHYYTHPPSRRDWQYDAILASLASTFPGERLRIAVLPNDPYFENNLFQLANETRNLHYQLDTFGDGPEPVEALSGYNVFISKTGSIAIAHTAKWRLAFRDVFTRWVAQDRHNPEFTLWTSRRLPDGSLAEVYLVR